MKSGPSQHAGLSPQRWAEFPIDKQILMIGNEMNRASASMKKPDMAKFVKKAYERILRLIDLTVEVNSNRALRRELLRFREVIGELYLADKPMPKQHHQAMRVLLLMNVSASAQLKHLNIRYGEVEG